jgi:hypothetical protein
MEQQDQVGRERKRGRDDAFVLALEMKIEKYSQGKDWVSRRWR